MGHQVSAIELIGKFRNMRGFKRPGTKGILVSAPGGGSKSHFNTSPSMARTRENASEQGAVFASSANVILYLITNVLKRVAGKSRNLLTKILRKLQETDTTNTRGHRSILFSDSNGVLSRLMTGINISKRNLNSVLRYVWHHSYAGGSGAYSIIFTNGLLPTDFFVVPKGANYFRLILSVCEAGDVTYDATTNKFEKAQATVGNSSDTGWVAIAAGLPAPTTLSVVTTHPFPASTGMIGDLQLQFAQTVGVGDYALIGDESDVVVSAGIPV